MIKDIYFAAGCFWGAQKYFKLIDGVMETAVGYANGNTLDPTYKEVYTDTTGYAETVRVQYDSSLVPLEFLVSMFFKAIDPLSLNRQGEDVGTRYRTGIYYSNPEDFPIISKVYIIRKTKRRKKLNRSDFLRKTKCSLCECYPLTSLYTN